MKPSPFLVNVSQILNTPGGRRHETRAGHLEGLKVSGSRVPPDADVTVDVNVERVESAVEVRGTVAVSWVGECGRCLKTVHGAITADVREVYEKNYVEGDTYPLKGDQIDLEPLARETVMLELPQAPLCREDCLGLCPTCGADLNEGACDCPTEVTDPRWAALDQLRTDT